MEEFWKEIVFRPEYVGMLAVVVILREIRKFVVSKKEEKPNHEDQLVNTLEKINENIGVNTELTREMVSRVKETDRKVEGIRGDLDDLRREVRRPLVP